MTPRGPGAEEGDDLDVPAFAGKLVVDDRLASLLVGPEIDLDTELVC